MLLAEMKIAEVEKAEIVTRHGHALLEYELQRLKHGKNIQETAKYVQFANMDLQRKIDIIRLSIA